jgi:hypothetical protein
MLYQAGEDQESLKYLRLAEKFLPEKYSASRLNMLKLKTLINPRLRTMYKKLMR